MTRLTAKGGATRNRILDETMTLLQARWYDGCSLREVSKACGIKLGNLQYYFPTREALFFDLIERQAKRDIAAMQAIIEGADDPETALSDIFYDLVNRWRRDDGSAYIVLQLLRPTSARFEALYRDIYSEHYRTIEVLLKQLKPGLPNSELAFKSRLITSLIDGGTMQVFDEAEATDFMNQIIEKAKAIALE